MRKNNWIAPGILTLLLMVSVVWGYNQYNIKTQHEVALENNYQRLFFDIKKHVENVQVNLSKALVASSKERNILLFSAIMSDANSARDKLGQMPLPPYITHQLQDKNRYQTVYAKYEGSAAAPTAGLHFTKELLEQIAGKGIVIANVTLHVGLGTFRPVKVDNILEHHMHSEFYQIEPEEAEKINVTKKKGGRVICVGTTSCRTVESAAGEDGLVKPGSGNTEIFIYPGYKFKILDALITNFHLPESTLIMLVSALAGRDHVLNAYEEAVKDRYRFFSFGDAMFIASFSKKD